jgi:hypothetical protein
VMLSATVNDFALHLAGGPGLFHYPSWRRERRRGSGLPPAANESF